MSNKVIVVTGGTKGIGRQISLELVDMGFKVAILFKSNDAKAVELEEEVIAKGGFLKAYKVSVEDYTEVTECFQKITNEIGPIGGLVNNAGITRDGYLMMMKEEDWKGVINTNLGGVLHCTHAVLPYMKEQKEGTIVTISSIAGYIGISGQVNYSAAKSALIGFTRGLAIETVKDNIGVFAIAPGFIQTEMLSTIPKAMMDKYISAIPMKRPGTTAEISGIVRSIFSKQFSYSTGHLFIADGGQNLV